MMIRINTNKPLGHRAHYQEDEGILKTRTGGKTRAFSLNGECAYLAIVHLCRNGAQREFLEV